MTRDSNTAAARLRRAALLGVLLAAASLAHAQDKSRAPCTLRAASGDVASDRADALSADVTGAKPVGLANWDVRWWQKHRLWITVDATNRGDAPTFVLPEIVVDLQRDGGLARSLVGDPLRLAPHAGASARMTLYVPADAKTVGVRMHAAASRTAATDVGVALRVDCSDSRFDVGEMKKSSAVLLDEALTLYLAELAVEPQDPRRVLDDVRVLAAGAQDGADVAWAMRGLMAALGDDRSTMTPAGAPAPVPARVETRPPEVERRPDGIAVLRLGAVDFRSDAERLAWAQALHDRIAALAATHPRGWIVDVREHEGGDIWASFAGLSSLLDGPVVGAFVTRQGRGEWVVERGASRIAGAPAQVDLQLPPEPPFTGPVAVLLGADTKNVGEAVAIAFEGRPHTRFFGAPTRGFPDLGVHAHALSDGSILSIHDADEADRNGQVSRGPIAPDDLVDASVHTDAPPQKAVDWLLAERAEGASAR